MEEDIKILENFIKNFEGRAVECVAIGNLINRNKELKKAIDNFMKGKTFSKAQLECINFNYISKSKTKKILKEYGTFKPFNGLLGSETFINTRYIEELLK